ncbi:hypothetical protein SAMN04487995_0930 [Dyadobacter koreensis]|uniref:Uncharacterized protein n=1 Tax=Dyadobacter koreensis TaxID=408657 RepID=A0A1H6QRM2_9BACT|nr:hypothetical protein [Dyadobacter koreensis]SEI46243.1 hypothetical protein SAMN04487995_0930 [Dyadobacter koreensis]
MKKLKVDFLFVAALLLSGGLAMANHSGMVASNVYNSTPNAASPTWTPIPAGATVSCDSDNTKLCSAFQDEEGNISEPVRGRASL